MKRRQTPNFFPRNESVLERLRDEANCRAEAIVAYANEDEALERQLRQRNLERTNGKEELSDELVVFWAASPLTSAMLMEELNQSLSVLRIREDEKMPLIALQDKLYSILEHLYENRWYGVSLTDVLVDGERLVKEKPVETYGFMLRSVRLPEDQEEAQNGFHAFVPVVEYPTEELDALIKKERFPKKMAETLIRLSTLYQKSLSQVKEAFFDPSSEHFSRTLGVYEDVFHNQQQRELFESQIFGSASENQGRVAYLKARDNVKNEASPDFYASIIYLIEHRYVDNLGEEVYGLLDIESEPEADADYQALSLAQTKKRRFLKQTKQARGEQQLADGKYGDLSLCNPVINYEKNGLKTTVTLKGFAAVSDGDGYIPIQFTLLGDGGYDWNFLRSEEEVPELFNTVLQAVNCALDGLMSQINQALTPPENQRVISREKVHVKDPIHELRKIAPEEEAEPEELVPSAGATEPMLWKVVFSEKVLKKNTEYEIRQAEIAVEKYQRRHSSMRKMYAKTMSGRKSFRLRQGDVRVLVELEEELGVLIVTDIGSRQGFYKGRN